jgi:cell division transport system ATP-binding protein
LLKVLYGQLPLKEGEGEVVGFDLKKLRASDVPTLEED